MNPTKLVFSRKWRPRGAGLWAVLGLVVFLQLASATHHHDEPGPALHDCAVCTQLQLSDHAHLNTHSLPTDAITVHGISCVSIQQGHSSALVVLPPARAPPRHA